MLNIIMAVRFHRLALELDRQLLLTLFIDVVFELVVCIYINGVVVLQCGGRHSS